MTSKTHSFHHILQSWITPIYSGVTKTENKLGISRFFRTIHNRYRVSSVYNPYTVSILSLSPRWTSVCMHERQRAQETMRLGLQCLANRLSESYRFQRIASSSIQRPKRYNEHTKLCGNRVKQWKYKDRLRTLNWGRNILSALLLWPEYINFAMSRFCIHRVCTLCVLWKYRRWATQRVYSVRYRVGWHLMWAHALHSIETSTEEQIVRYAAPMSQPSTSRITNRHTRLTVGMTAVIISFFIRRGDGNGAIAAYQS